MTLFKKYRNKRDFTKTAEPRGGAGRRGRTKRDASGRSFVIHKHAARRLHYDFRLELDGALLSWAVPKGPSLDPSVKRLAVETEPHPLEYGEFEGTIPKGQYGGGTVMVWDRGSWEPKGDAKKGYEKGHLAFSLRGQKLRGDWHLVRTRKGTKDGKTWLLFKSRDEFAKTDGGAMLDEKAASAATGRSMEDIAAGRRGKRGKGGALPGAKPKNLEKNVEPELATLVDAPPSGDGWLHEIKLDGYRLLARIEDGEVRLLTRKSNDWTERMPALAEHFSKLDVRSALVDGELVALNDQGISDFQALQNSLSGDRNAPLVYYAFDLLHLNGMDLRDVPLVERKALLGELLGGMRREQAAVIRLSEHIVGQGPELFRKASTLGVEGIVSKRAASPYRSGRGRDWLKIKCTMRQEFVVVGYTEPAGSRSHFGALLVGVRKDGELVYAGRVGTGFTDDSLRELHEKLAPLEVDKPPVVNAPRGANARGVRWVRPKLVAEVAFTGFTDDGVLRHPAFQGLRDDKSAREVRLETAARESSHMAYPLTNPDKVLYPEAGITKRELLEYYELVSERMLPHVVNRPLTLFRAPDGRAKPGFFQKHPGKGTPEAIRSIAIRDKEGKAPYSVIDDAEGLFGLVQLGSLEIHTWGSRADDFEHPDLLVFDLDPDPSVEFSAVIACAREIRAVFEDAKLESFVKTTGGKGLHVCIPIEPDLDWALIKDFSGRIAEALVRRAPDKYVATVSKARRKGKIFIDYLRNMRGATFIAPYSTRARDNAPVAVPLDWDELTPRLGPAEFTVRTLKRRLERLRRDPFERMATLRQRLRT